MLENIDPNFEKGGFLIVQAGYHDTLFPLSQLKNVTQNTVDLDVANGVGKYDIGEAVRPHYEVGEPVFIYRKFMGDNPGHRSCFTSICVVTEVILAKEFGKAKMTIDQLLARIGNKSVYDEDEIRTKFNNGKTVTVIGLLYYGYFGEGHNINWIWLKNHGYWDKGGVQYPTETQYTPEDVETILREANIDVQNIIID